MYDLIIIGGGPAGITAGIYAARQKLKTLLITKSFGGQIAIKTVEIENYPGFEKISATDLIKNFENHLRKFEIDIKMNSVIKIEKNGNFFSVLIKDGQLFQAKTIIITSGADRRPLKVPGEKEFIGRGVSYCAVCDGPMFSNKSVVIIGGGDAGFETALALNQWAKKIYILERSLKTSASLENQEKIKDTEKIEIITNVILKEIRGDKFVNSIIYQDRILKKDNILNVDGVFVEIGSLPAVSFIENGLVDFNEKCEIKINHQTCQTKTPGLFAAGDVTETKNKQIVIAAGEGAKAALSAYEYLQKF